MFMRFLLSILLLLKFLVDAELRLKISHLHDPLANVKYSDWLENLQVKSSQHHYATLDMNQPEPGMVTIKVSGDAWALLLVPDKNGSLNIAHTYGPKETVQGSNGHPKGQS